MNRKKKLELYIHIPFCMKKCLYCDFLSFPSDLQTQAEYMDQLRSEILSSGPWYGDYEVSTIFIGGGTPSALEPEQITLLMQAVHRAFQVAEDAEITIEANPGTRLADKLPAYRAAGINRISLGLQSANNEELKFLGRIHRFEDFLMAFQQARMAGFTNINVDLMSAVPGQTVDSWKNTLKKIIMLKPEHISAYSLIIEEGTPFGEHYGCQEERKQREKQERREAMLCHEEDCGVETNLKAETDRQAETDPAAGTDYTVKEYPAAAAAYGAEGNRAGETVPAAKSSRTPEAVPAAKSVRPAEAVPAAATRSEAQGPIIGDFWRGRDPKKPDPLYQWPPLVDEEEERRMYHLTKTLLEDAGYQRYEISNYAKPGQECRHNIGYWTGVEYLGFGLGASSYVDGCRFSNVEDMETYQSLDFSLDGLELLHGDIHAQSRKEQMEEFMFLGLRMTEGVSDAVFTQTFGVHMDSVYGAVIERMVKHGLLVQDEKNLALTEWGMDVSNYVMSEFLLD
ncbi:MAG: radical SAM family heme chaperone HemW [Lachnospiraceae bacterium]|nr:radical SAM family heme chaperone HemW [Lachnospiraceae bacterium]